MSKLNVQLCPETGICSIVKEDGSKVDLMPDEVRGMRTVSGNADAIRKTLGEIDASFAEKLAEDELAQISQKLR